MIKRLFNPFLYVAGSKSLLIGLAIMLATTAVSYFSHIHFPDPISVKVAIGFPLWVYLVQNLANWLVVSVLFYIAALVLSKSSVRAIDIFGTQALARAPYLIASFTGFTGVLETFGKFLLWITTNTGNPVEITGAQILFAVLLLILTMVLTVWLVALMFNAFKVSSNLKGAKLIVSFIVIMLISIGIMLKITFMIVPHNTPLI